MGNLHGTATATVLPLSTLATPLAAAESCSSVVALRLSSVFFPASSQG